MTSRENSWWWWCWCMFVQDALILYTVVLFCDPTRIALRPIKDIFFHPTGRSDGVYSKPCRHEKSPSKSNEVISPEILKMRAALFCIFTYLDTKTLLRAAEVCRDWKFVARHPAVWTRVLLENARISSKVRGGTLKYRVAAWPKQEHAVRWTVFVCRRFEVVSMFVPQFLSILSQWCTQTHSLILQNLKPRQRGKKESKEDYLKSTRWEAFSCTLSPVEKPEGQENYCCLSLCCWWPSDLFPSKWLSGGRSGGVVKGHWK